MTWLPSIAYSWNSLNADRGWGSLWATQNELSPTAHPTCWDFSSSTDFLLSLKGFPLGLSQGFAGAMAWPWHFHLQRMYWLDVSYGRGYCPACTSSPLRGFAVPTAANGPSAAGCTFLQSVCLSIELSDPRNCWWNRPTQSHFHRQLEKSLWWETGWFETALSWSAPIVCRRSLYAGSFFRHITMIQQKIGLTDTIEFWFIGPHNKVPWTLLHISVIPLEFKADLPVFLGHSRLLSCCGRA